MKSFSDGLRSHWLECKITEITEVTECEPEEARQIAEEFFGTTRIPLRYTLYFEECGYVTAAEVLSKGEMYDQQSLCDPFRYNHTRGHDEAVFCWNAGDPMICRATDGRKLYDFADDCSRGLKLTKHGRWSQIMALSINDVSPNLLNDKQHVGLRFRLRHYNWSYRR